MLHPSSKDEAGLNAEATSLTSSSRLVGTSKPPTRVQYRSISYPTTTRAEHGRALRSSTRVNVPWLTVPAGATSGSKTRGGPFSPDGPKRAQTCRFLGDPRPELPDADSVGRPRTQHRRVGVSAPPAPAGDAPRSFVSSISEARRTPRRPENDRPQVARASERYAEGDTTTCTRSRWETPIRSAQGSRRRLESIHIGKYHPTV